jgi:hypothetical protein
MTDDFIKNIPEDYILGVNYIIEHFYEYGEYYNNNQDVPIREYHNEIVDYYILLEAYLISKGQKIDSLELSDNMTANIELIFTYISSIEESFAKALTSNTITEARDRFNRLLGNNFSYEFTSGDLNRIQELINELRSNISESELFTADHKQRLLKRLEKIQSELHKRVSDLDKFWGLIGDAGVAIGKFGNDAKPFVDRIREIADIVWRTQSKAEELPSAANIPFLTRNTGE